MAIARAFAATAMFAGLALGLAAPASAENEMSGHYVEIVTGPDGQTGTNDWYFTPCGDGCADVSGRSGLKGRALLVNGQWTMDITLASVCPDGTRVPNNVTARWTWDPNFLAGTDQIVNTAAACGIAPGTVTTNTVQFRQAP